MLRIEHLTKKYGDYAAVNDLSLHIQPGEIYGFIGHNGAGKTTTLKCVAGILNFDNGSISINGADIQKDPLGAKKIMAYIPDNPDLYDYMTAIQYLNFIADIFGVSQQDREARIKKYGDMFELTEKLAQPVSAYSHGMKQKLAVMGALVHDPKLILMDEICNNGGAIFFSTHVLDVAEKLCDKVAIIKAGKLIRSGTMDEVKGDESLEEVFLELQNGAAMFDGNNAMNIEIPNFK